MYFYQEVDALTYSSIVDDLMNRSRQNGIEPDITNDIIIVWNDAERDNEDEGSLPLFGKLYVSQQLLNLV